MRITLINTTSLKLVWERLNRTFLLVLISFSVALPGMLLNQTAIAAQLTNRSLTISTSAAGATAVTYTFGIKLATSSAVQSMSFQGCTTAVGSCTAPTGLNISAATAPAIAGMSGTPSVTQDTTDAPANGSGMSCAVSSHNDYCLKTGDSTAQTAPEAITVTFSSDVTNPTSANTSFYFRIYSYSDTALATPVDNGNVAASTTNTFQVNASIAEQLTFCVGSVTAAAATIDSYNSNAVPSCTTMSGSSLNLGTLQSGTVSVSPVPNTTLYNGDSSNAVMELATNSDLGTAITYSAVQAPTGTNHLGSLRVAGATCSATTSLTDQCINSLSPANTITPGSGAEAFGMAVMGINCYNVPAGTETCNQTNHNLAINSNYYCNANIAGGTYGSFSSGKFDTGPTTSTTLCNYMWDEASTNDTFATVASGNIVANEAPVLEFAATPAITTPTGVYSVQANFVATPTF